MLNAQQISTCTRTLDKFIFSRTHVGTPRLEMGHLIEKLTKGWDILTAKIPLTCMLNAQQISTCTRTLDKFIFSRTHVGTPRLEMGHLIEKLTKGWDILTAKIPLTCMLNAQQISTCTCTLDKFVFSRTHVGTPRLEMGHLIEKLTKGWDILTAKIPLTCMLNAQQISTCTCTLDKFVFSRTHVGTPRLEMGHLIEKLTKGWDILTAKIPLTCMLNAQQISTCTRTLDKFVFSRTHVGTPRLEMGHLIEKLTKGWDILTAKIPLTCMLNAQQISTCTRTLDKFVFSRTHVGTPRLEMGHLIEKLTKGWDILTAKIPLTYMLNAQQISTCTRTLDKFVFSRTHVGTPRLEMGHLIEKLTKGWDILTAKIPLTYMLNA